MAIPKWHEFMAPILQVMKDGEVRDRSGIADLAAGVVGVTDEERKVVLTTGQAKYANRVGWAISHLTKAGALQRPQRGAYVITDAGHRVLEERPSVTLEDVGSVLGYRRTPGATVATELGPSSTGSESLDPEELIDQGITQIHADVASELLTRIHEKAPAFFEHVVVELLVAMGYGGGDAQHTVTQQSNDGGIDGVIDQDTLGLRRVYVQAKRYAADNTVTRPAIQGFVGALDGKADAGVFITTSTFSAGAREYAEGRSNRIILIDGARLALLMIRFGVGVQVKQVVHLVQIDEDFFD